MKASEELMLTLENMRRRWPHGDQHIPGLIEGIVKASDAVFSKYGVTTQLMIAHVMAQFSTECGQGLEMTENLNYSAEGLLKTFPTHFTADMAARAAHNQQMIGQIAYGGRMGNAPPPSLDGYTYRGAGLSQVTGKAGVAALQAFLAKNGDDFDIVQNPELIIDPDHALEVGVADLAQLGCLPFAEKDDIVSVTKHLNGGLNGLPDRRLQLAAWKTELGVS
jgi:putative chitinase